MADLPPKPSTNVWLRALEHCECQSLSFADAWPLSSRSCFAGFINVFPVFSVAAGARLSTSAVGAQMILVCVIYLVICDTPSTIHVARLAILRDSIVNMMVSIVTVHIPYIAGAPVGALRTLLPLFCGRMAPHPRKRCRVDLAHVRQSRPDSGLGCGHFHVKVVNVFPFRRCERLSTASSTRSPSRTHGPSFARSPNSGIVSAFFQGMWIKIDT